MSTDGIPEHSEDSLITMLEIAGCVPGKDWRFGATPDGPQLVLSPAGLRTMADAVADGRVAQKTGTAQDLRDLARALEQRGN